MNLGAVGLGRMGGAIARRLLAAGYRVAVRDVSPALREPFQAAGASWQGSAAEVAAASDVVLLSLPGPAEVDEVMLGHAGVLAAAKPGALIVQTSTIGPAQSRSLALECARLNVDFLDAPVSGGVEGAQSGTLAIMVGGERAALDRVRPVLECFGKRIFHLGPAGAGSGMKLVIQSAYLSQLAVFLESVAMGQAMGMPLEAMLEVLAESSAHHPTIGKRYAQMIANDLTPRFEVKAALKDLGLVRDQWKELGIEAQIVDAVVSSLDRAARAGFADKDVIALREVYRHAQ